MAMTVTVNKKPAPFLEGIDLLILDMDGVITSEEYYWNSAALTVYEMLTSDKYFGINEFNADITNDELMKIRDKVFLNDAIIALLKNIGINTNWDLAFVTLGAILIKNKIKSIKFESRNFISLPDFVEVFEYFQNLDLDAVSLYSHISEELSKLTDESLEYFARHGEFWNRCQQIFQEWYLGDELFVEVYGHNPHQIGKKGLIYDEEPLIPLGELKEILSTLTSAGINLGIGTGRAYYEIHTPLKKWDLEKYFNADAYITYSDVVNAEGLLSGLGHNLGLGKPHPFMFLKAVYGKDYSTQKLIDGIFNKDLLENVLIVGDAGSDIMAAKAIPCKFAAVLTGITGKGAKPYFEDMGADYILDSIREFIV